MLGGVVELCLGGWLLGAGFAPYRMSQYARVHAPVGSVYPYGESTVL